MDGEEGASWPRKENLLFKASGDFASFFTSSFFTSSFLGVGLTSSFCFFSSGGGVAKGGNDEGGAKIDVYVTGPCAMDAGPGEELLVEEGGGREGAEREGEGAEGEGEEGEGEGEEGDGDGEEDEIVSLFIGESNLKGF